MRPDDESRVVITGIGVLSPFGMGKKLFWDALAAGRSGIKPVTLFDTSAMRSKTAGEISDFKAEDILGPKGLRNLDRTTLLALCAAKLCLDDADFQITEGNANRVGVVLGTTMGSVWSISEFDKEGLRNGPRAVNPAAFPNTVMNAPASQISIRFGIKGFNTTISSGFTSSLDALMYAETFLTLGRADAVLVGGVEELCEQTFKGLYKLGFLSGSKGRGSERCTPFDRMRNGVVLGEGASLFLIERYSSAKRRNARVYAEVRSVETAFDRKSYYRYNPRAEGAKIAAKKAIEASGIPADKIGYITTGANSTLDGDLAEVRALHNLFARKLMVNAIKSMIGETLSASGAFQVASALLGMQENVVPPTINFTEADERCPSIDCVPNEARRLQTDSILVTNLSPMGQNAAVVLSRVGA